MSWFTIAELSAPQLVHTKLMGDCAISGVMSNEYLSPQEHWIFMR